MFPMHTDSADRNRVKVNTPALAMKEVTSQLLPIPKHMSEIQQSKQGAINMTLMQIHFTHAPSIPGHPVCMAPAQHQTRKPLDCTYPPPATPLVWPQMLPTLETPTLCPSTPIYSTMRAQPVSHWKFLECAPWHRPYCQCGP